MPKYKTEPDIKTTTPDTAANEPCPYCGEVGKHLPYCVVVLKVTNNCKTGKYCGSCALKLSGTCKNVVMPGGKA